MVDTPEISIASTPRCVGVVFKGRYVESSPTTLRIVCPFCEEALQSIQDTRVHFETCDDFHRKWSPFKEMSTDALTAVLNTTIKKDEAVKAITFYDMLLAQTDGSQFNIMFSSSSSTGKTYDVSQVSDYFPRSEVLEIAGASPTSFVHDVGVRVVETQPGHYEELSPILEKLQGELSDLQASTTAADRRRKRELKGEISGLLDRAKVLVNLKGKIVIFLDQPNGVLLSKIRPFLSHDRQDLEFTITDKNSGGANRTKHVIMRGYASVFFCTAYSVIDEQESTRLLVLSPETTSEKIVESLNLTAEKLGDSQKFEEGLENDPARTSLKFRIELIRASGIKGFLSDGKAIVSRFMSEHHNVRPRYQRDLPRLFSLVQASALLNCFNRELNSSETISVNQSDIDAGFSLYSQVMKSNELGVSDEVLRFYQEVMLPLYEEKKCGLGYRELGAKYYDLYHRTVSQDRLRQQFIPSLLTAGLVSEDQDPTNRRRSIFAPNMRGAGVDKTEPIESVVADNATNSTLNTKDVHHDPTHIMTPTSP
jgi:hypothetical protein